MFGWGGGKKRKKGEKFVWGGGGGGGGGGGWGGGRHDEVANVRNEDSQGEGRPASVAAEKEWATTTPSTP